MIAGKTRMIAVARQATSIPHFHSRIILIHVQINIARRKLNYHFMFLQIL
jgi:hypothetical protein